MLVIKMLAKIYMYNKLINSIEDGSLVTFKAKCMSIQYYLFNFYGIVFMVRKHEKYIILLEYLLLKLTTSM